MMKGRKKYRIIRMTRSGLYTVQRQILNIWITIVSYPTVDAARDYILNKSKSKQPEYEFIKEYII